VAATAGPLDGHSFRLSLLRLGELRRDDDQAQVDHEERADLITSTFNKSVFSRVRGIMRKNFANYAQRF